MSQKLLYRTQVGAIIKKVGSKGMPERMRRQVFSYPRPTAVILDYLPESLAGHAVSVNCKKKRLFNFIAVMQKAWSDRRQVFLEIACGNAAKRYQSFFGSHDYTNEKIHEQE